MAFLDFAAERIGEKDCHHLFWGDMMLPGKLVNNLREPNDIDNVHAQSFQRMIALIIILLFLPGNKLVLPDY
jgi:hypothetical protein